MRRSPYGFDPLENCVKCRIRSADFFCEMDHDALEAFDRLTYTSVSPAHTTLISEGEAPRGVYLICRGKVRSSIASGDGKTLVIQVAHAGEALGISSVLTGREYAVTCETLEPTQIKFIKRDDFLRFIEAHPATCLNACRQLATAVEIENEQIRSVALSHSAAEKLAHLILTWCETGRSAEDGTRVPLLMTHHEISQLIGTSRETVTRLLKDFRQRSILSIKGSTMTIHDRPALEAIVGN